MRGRVCRKFECPPPASSPAPAPASGSRLRVPSFPGWQAGRGGSWRRTADRRAPAPCSLPGYRLPFVFPGGDERRTSAAAAGARTPALLATSPASALVPGSGPRPPQPLQASAPNLGSGSPRTESCSGAGREGAGCGAAGLRGGRACAPACAAIRFSACVCVCVCVCLRARVCVYARVLVCLCFSVWWTCR
jgi:hypothetical protein